MDLSPTAQNDKMRHFAQNDNTYTMRFLKFTQTRLYKVLCWLITFNFVSIAWVFFRAENLQGAFNLLKAMFGAVWVELPQKWHRMPETLAQIDGRNDTIFYILISILVCVFCKISNQILQLLFVLTFFICWFWFFACKFFICRYFTMQKYGWSFNTILKIVQMMILYISNMLTRGNGYKKYISLSGEI